MHPFFFFNDTATTEIYTLSLHDALPISSQTGRQYCAVDSITTSSTWRSTSQPASARRSAGLVPTLWRSEEHTSELQSQSNIVCRLLLEKKKHQSLYSPQELAPLSPKTLA